MIRLNFHQEHFQAVVDALSSSCTGPLNFTWESIIIIICCVLGLIWALVNMLSVSKINVEEGYFGEEDNDSDDSDYRGRRTNDIPRKQK